MFNGARLVGPSIAGLLIAAVGEGWCFLLNGLSYIAVIIALPIGILSAVKQYSLFDQSATFASFVGFSLPSFFTGLVLILVFAVGLGWFPIVYNSTLQVTNFQTFLEQVKQMVLPVTVLVVQQTGALTRFMRSSMLDNIPQEYVRTARSKGLNERTVITRTVGRVSQAQVLMAVTAPSLTSLSYQPAAPSVIDGSSGRAGFAMMQHRSEHSSVGTGCEPGAALEQAAKELRVVVANERGSPRRPCLRSQAAAWPPLCAGSAHIRSVSSPSRS
jgi:hypothetical protein